MPQTSAREPQGKDLVDAMLPVGDVRAASNERWRQQVNNTAGRERGSVFVGGRDKNREVKGVCRRTGRSEGVPASAAIEGVNTWI